MNWFTFLNFICGFLLSSMEIYIILTTHEFLCFSYLAYVSILISFLESLFIEKNVLCFILENNVRSMFMNLYYFFVEKWF